MKKLVYSPQYKRKLIGIKRYLDIRFGERIRKQALRAITDRLHLVQKYEKSGNSIRNIYGIDTDYQYVFIAHNYVFYRIDAEYIRVVNIYYEREDFMFDLFGIRSVSDDAEAYWDEIEHGFNEPFV